MQNFLEGARLGPGGKAQVCQVAKAGSFPGEGASALLARHQHTRDTPLVQQVMNHKFPLGLSVPITAFQSDPLGPLKFHRQGSCSRQEHPAGVPGGAAEGG